MACQRGIRRTVALAGGLIVLYTAEAAGVVSATGADVWNLPALERQLEDDRRKSGVLVGLEDRVLSRMAVKEALMGDLLAGRCTLGDVTDSFYRLNSETPEVNNLLCANFQCTDEREATARNVLAYASCRQGLPGAQSATNARLRGEFHALFGRPAD